MLTNGKGEWLEELTRGLEGLGGWVDEEPIRTSRDLGRRLGKEERGVAQAVDMAIAQRAEVFVGNGVRPYLTFRRSGLVAVTFVSLLTGRSLSVVLEFDVEREHATDGSTEGEAREYAVLVIVGGVGRIG